MEAPSFQLFGIKLLGSPFTLSFRDHVLVTRKFCWFYRKRILGIKLHLTLSSANSLAWSYLVWVIAAASTLVFLLWTLTSLQSVLNTHQVITVTWISSRSSFAPKHLAPSHSETVNSFYIYPPLGCLSDPLSYEFSLLHTPLRWHWSHHSSSKPGVFLHANHFPCCFLSLGCPHLWSCP